MFDWTDDQVAIREAVRQFVDKEVRPLQDELEHEADECGPQRDLPRQPGRAELGEPLRRVGAVTGGP